MSIIAWIILGLVAGVIAKMLVPGRDPQGLVITTLIGIAGAVLGGLFATRVFDVAGTQGFFNLSTWITAIAGAAVLLLAYHVVSGQNNGRRSGRRSGRWAGRR
jgi:uncharacterized membrane protein YeaQ/YmgE (transglycosylase-associated protein family)